MDAAAMDAEVASPWTRHREGTDSGGFLFPSTRARAGFTGRASTARFMASMAAWRMLMRSISSTVATPTAQATACSVMRSYRASRFFSDSFLESLMPGISASRGRITAAA